MAKHKKTHYQNIKGLLNKYKEEKIEYIEDKGYFSLKPKKMIWCEICKNFDSKKRFCNTYDCYPLEHKIPVEEYYNEFTLDKIKEAEESKSLKLSF